MSRPRYTLDELLAEAEASGAYPLPAIGPAHQCRRNLAVIALPIEHDRPAASVINFPGFKLLEQLE